MPTPLPVHLSCEIIWGEERTEARGFDPSVGRLVVAPAEDAAFPLYGFDIDDAGHLLAEWTPEGLWICPPPHASVELLKGAAPLTHATRNGRAGFWLQEGQRVALARDELRLVLTADRQGVKTRVDHTSAWIWSMVAAVLFVVIPVSFLTVSPDPEASSAYATRTLERERQRKRAELALRQKDGGLGFVLSSEPAAPAQDPSRRVPPAPRAVLPTSLSTQ